MGVGYNSIRFDDEVTRHLFWRNLIDPYAREWQNGCGRWDLLDVVRCTWALRPEGIEWPRHDDGRPSFKLEHLTAANGLVHEAAHDALSDVRATIALARWSRQQQPRLWDFCLKLRKKDAVRAEMGVGRPFLHLSGMYPVERGCLAIVWPLAPHPTNKNEVIVWDLAQDPARWPAWTPTPCASACSRAGRIARGRAAAAHQDHPHQQVAHRHRQPATLGDAAERWGLDVDAAMAPRQHAQALGGALDAPVAARCSRARRRWQRRCRRGPVRRLHRP
jgi:exodeoxyribonuclease-1